MDKENKFSFDSNWYELWMKQSKDFFDTANVNLKNMMGKNGFANPHDHLADVKKWQEQLMAQWDTHQLHEQQQLYANYWKMMTNMCQEAFEHMVSEWTKRNKDNQPIKNTHELYELWLNSCNEIYKKSTAKKSYQDAYMEFVNEGLKFWRNSLAN